MARNMADEVAVARPSTDELVARARALLPRLRERAEHAEALRRVPEETLTDFRQAGLFRVFQPARYGGYEMDYGVTQIELASVLGRACGSSAWVQSVVACHAWLLGMFPAVAQDAVWGADPDALLSTSFSTANGVGRPIDGGYLVQGQWQFSSGVDACDWAILGVPVETDAGARAVRFCLVPRSDWEIVDTWFAAGLRGTGSKDVLVKEAFVPQDFTLDPVRPSGQPSPGSAVNPSYIYRLPISPIFPFNVMTPALGIARGVLETFVEQTAGRPERAGEPGRQLRVAESAAELDAAEALLRADAADIIRLGRSAAPIAPEHLVKWKRDLAFAGQLCLRAAERLAAAVGAHGILEANPIHRASRDLHAIANHAGLNWENAAIPYGRLAFGLSPS